MQNEEFRKAGKEVSAFVKRIFKDRKKLILINEWDVLQQNLKFIENETGLKVILDTQRVPEDKRKLAVPGKPAIYVG